MSAGYLPTRNALNKTHSLLTSIVLQRNLSVSDRLRLPL